MKNQLNSKQVYLCLTVSLVLLSEGALSAGGASTHEIPWKTILFQAINLSVVLGGLGYLIAKKSGSYFRARSEQFLNLVKRAEVERQQAEQKLKEFEQRIKDLNTSSELTLKAAEEEAQKLQNALAAEAEQLSAQIRVEANRTAQFEVERAKKQLTASLLERAVAQAKENMSIQESDQQRLKNEFVQKIQVVHS